MNVKSLGDGRVVVRELPDLSKIRVWNSDTWQEEFSFDHQTDVLDFDVALDGDHIICCDVEQNITCWNVHTKVKFSYVEFCKINLIFLTLVTFIYRLLTYVLLMYYQCRWHFLNYRHLRNHGIPITIGITITISIAITITIKINITITITITITINTVIIIYIIFITITIISIIKMK